jgi:hypothetical protein
MAVRISLANFFECCSSSHGWLKISMSYVPETQYPRSSSFHSAEVWPLVHRRMSRSLQGLVTPPSVPRWLISAEAPVQAVAMLLVVASEPCASLRRLRFTPDPGYIEEVFGSEHPAAVLKLHHLTAV